MIALRCGRECGVRRVLEESNGLRVGGRKGSGREGGGGGVSVPVKVRDEPPLVRQGYADEGGKVEAEEGVEGDGEGMRRLRWMVRRWRRLRWRER